MLLTPHVIRSDDELDEAMEELRKQFRGLRQSLPVWEEKKRASSRERTGRAGIDGLSKNNGVSPPEAAAYDSLP